MVVACLHKTSHREISRPCPVVTTKKCTKKCNSRAELFFDVLVVVVGVAKGLYWENRGYIGTLCNEVLGITNDILKPRLLKCVEQHLDITNQSLVGRVALVPYHFVNSTVHNSSCIHFKQLRKKIVILTLAVATEIFI